MPRKLCNCETLKQDTPRGMGIVLSLHTPRGMGIGLSLHTPRGMGIVLFPPNRAPFCATSFSER